MLDTIARTASALREGAILPFRCGRRTAFELWPIMVHCRQVASDHSTVRGFQGVLSWIACRSTCMTYFGLREREATRPQDALTSLAIPLLLDAGAIGTIAPLFVPHTGKQHVGAMISRQRSLCQAVVSPARYVPSRGSRISSNRAPRRGSFPRQGRWSFSGCAQCQLAPTPLALNSACTQLRLQLEETLTPT